MEGGFERCSYIWSVYLNRYRHCIDGVPFRTILFDESGVRRREDMTNRPLRLGLLFTRSAEYVSKSPQWLHPAPGTRLSITTIRKHKAQSSPALL